MNHCAVQQNAFAACEEMRSPLSSFSDRKNPVFCPKPRRLGQLSGADLIRPLRWQLSYQSDLCDSKAGAEILDIILTKGSYSGSEPALGGSPAASSPPYFCGSPPSRSANPLVQDARFGEEKPPTLLTPLPVPAGMPTSPSTSGGGGARKVAGCIRTKFGPKPAAVRIEGFDCLDRDRRNCSIPAVA